MFSHIVLPLDGSSLAECVLPHAAAIAGACGSQISILHVLNQNDIMGGADALEWQREEIKVMEYLQKAVRCLESEGVKAKAAILAGNPAEQILSFSHQQSNALILLSSHGRGGLTEWGTGSVATKVAMRARTSVMLIPGFTRRNTRDTQMCYRRVLVPLDCSRRAEYVLPLANILACAHGAEIHLLHVIKYPEIPHQGPLMEDEKDWANRMVKHNQAQAADYFAELEKRLPAHTRVKICFPSNDSILTSIHKYAIQNEIELVLMTAHGYSGECRRPYGSMALSAIVYGGIPLLVAQDARPEQIESTRAEVYAESQQAIYCKQIAQDKH